MTRKKRPRIPRIKKPRPTDFLVTREENRLNLDLIEELIRKDVNMTVEMKQFKGGFKYTNHVKEKERFDLLAEYRSRIGYTVADLMKYLSNQDTSK